MNSRTLSLVIAAAIGGGAIGAAATAAEQAAATRGAIATAVQRTKDAVADQALSKIETAILQMQQSDHAACVNLAALGQGSSGALQQSFCGDGGSR